MKCDFIQSVIKTTCWLAIFFSFFIALNFGIVESAAFLAGAIWSCANIHFIKYLIQNIAKEQKNFLSIAMIAFIKFPILYFTLYYLLTNLPLLYAALGSAIFFVSLCFNSLRNGIYKTAIFAASFLLGSRQLHASLEADVPEVPNIFTLLHSIYDSPWTAFLHEWETFIFSAVVAIFLSSLFYLGSRKTELIPEGLQNFLESIVEVLRNFILEVVGPQGEKFVPLLGTLFIYILAMNWVAIIPFMKPPTSSINITIALAICVFALVQYLNIKNWGFLGFLYHMAGSPKDFLSWALVPLMLPIELLTQITRPMTLALRLFGNVVGEDILIGAAALFGVYLLSSSPLIGGVPVQLPFLFLALLTGLMQALVFTLLSAIYILLSMPEEETENH